MLTRVGDHLYQSAAYNLPCFPLQAAKSILPAECLLEGTPEGVSTWCLGSTRDVNKFLSRLLPAGTTRGAKMSSGSTKAFKSKSERVIRVVSHVLAGMEMSHVLLASGLTRLYINFTYVLADEDGEMHAPKDMNRIEIALHPDLERKTRQTILADVKKMGRKGLPLSAGWWRQLGEGKKARAVDIYSVAYDVDSLVNMEEQPTGRYYLVQWAGYRPEWEVERIYGSPGDPIMTWEPRSALLSLSVLHEWEELEEGIT